MESANDDAANNSRRTTDGKITLDDDAAVAVRLDREDLSFIIVLVVAFTGGGIVVVVMVHSCLSTETMRKKSHDALGTRTMELYCRVTDRVCLRLTT